MKQHLCHNHIVQIRENKVTCCVVFLYAVFLTWFYSFDSRQTSFLLTYPSKSEDNTSKSGKIKPETTTGANKLKCLSLVTNDRMRFHDDKAKNPNDPFFGLIYKDAYGTSTNYTEIKPNDWFSQFTNGQPAWSTFMPQTVYSIQQYKQHNPHENKTMFTSRESVVTVIDSTSYEVGQHFVARIQARNFLNQNKHFGGDYFRAVLIKKLPSTEKLRDGIPCSIQDHLNGTYTLSAPLLVPGTYVLEVLLCASVELISTYVEWTNERLHEGYLFEATLESNEKIYCNSDLLLHDRYKQQPLCNYSNPRNGEPYFCSMPKSGNCSTIKLITNAPNRYGPTLHYKQPFDDTDKLNARFDKDKPITGSGFVFNVFTKNSIINKNQNVLLQNDQASTTSSENGYSFKGEWVSLTKNYERRPLTEFAACFSNRIFYILGDSTARQFFILLQNKFFLNVTTTQPITYHHYLRVGTNDKLNISVYYRAHGVPIRLDGPPNLAPHITDVIDALETGGPNVVVTFTLGLHCLAYHPSLYIHRLLGIKQAILRHHACHPETKFIIKGINISIDFYYPFEWLMLRYNVLLKEVFRNIPNVEFVDLWDMTTVWPVKGYHPEDNVLMEQAILMFSGLCR